MRRWSERSWSSRFLATGGSVAAYVVCVEMRSTIRITGHLNKQVSRRGEAFAAFLLRTSEGGNPHAQTPFLLFRRVRRDRRLQRRRHRSPRSPVPCSARVLGGSGVVSAAGHGGSG